MSTALGTIHVGRWLTEVANHRIHGTTGERPDQRMILESQALLALPERGQILVPTHAGHRRPMPTESLQHPLSVYNALLEARA